MWSLLIGRLAPPAPAIYHREALEQAAVEAVRRLVAARRARWELGRGLAALAHGAHQGSAPARQMEAAYGQLSTAIARAEETMRAERDALAPELGPTNPAAEFRNYGGIRRLGASTLGPAEPRRAGVVNSGEDVASLQQFLRAYGFQINATGDFDLQTRLVLQKFQEEHGLAEAADGLVGAETRQLVNDLIEGR